MLGARSMVAPRVATVTIFFLASVTIFFIVFFPSARTGVMILADDMMSPPGVESYKVFGLKCRYGLHLTVLDRDATASVCRVIAFSPGSEQADEIVERLFTHGAGICGS